MFIILFVIQIISGILYILCDKRAGKIELSQKLSDKKRLKKYIYISSISKGIMYGMFPVYLVIK